MIRDGEAFACSSLPIERTFAGDLLGLDGKGADDGARLRLAPKRPAKNPELAPAWRYPVDGEPGEIDEPSGAAGSVAALDPRLI